MIDTPDQSSSAAVADRPKGSVILDIQGAEVVFQTPGGDLPAVDNVSLSVRRGEAVAVVGESGCGKTTLARAVLGLQALDSGQILVDGKPVTKPDRSVAKRIGMVWQDPFASLEPRWTVRKTLEEPFRLTGGKPDVDRIMQEVGLDPALASRYPHQLSGGQRQRVAIGRALAVRPPLVVCDEPTAALDLSIQAQILNLLKDIKEQTDSAFLYISHDLLTVRYLADRVAVMYMGEVVEYGDTQAVFEAPRHPYTRALIESAPSLENLGHVPPEAQGEIPDPREAFRGCKFASRCPQVGDDCLQGRISLFGDIRPARCVRPIAPEEPPR